MNALNHIRSLLLVCSLVVASQPLPGVAQQNSDAVKPAERDGQHDFTGVCRKVWDGAELDEAKFDGPTDHIEGLVLRLYNPESHQRSLNRVNRKDGPLVPPQIGELKNGTRRVFRRGQVNGRVILIRFVWTNMTTSTLHFEQSFSDDGGKTWEVNWITDQTRVNDESDTAH